MKKGDLYYLAHPDEQSQGKVIREGHGYIWAYARESGSPSGSHYVSLATGVEFYFYFPEMQAMEPVDDGEG
jgi:hypothetical protein